VINTLVTITRIPKGQTQSETIAQNVVAQIDEKNPEMAAYYDKSHPYDIFDAYLKAGYGWQLLRGDLLTDQQNTDPLTGTNTLYRVVGRPEAFPNGHIEAVVNQFGGPS
jgi:hypothetical protein